jgi:hypothetical protein
MEHNIICLLITIATSAIIYAGMMITVFKNEHASQTLHVIVEK